MDVFGNVFDKVKEAEKDVAQKERQYDLSGSVEDMIRFSKARAQLQYALLCEETLLRQQSSVPWVWEGDTNTHFFHAMVQKKRQLFHVHRI